MYNFNHLYYFYITAKSGGVNAAANHLQISQPSLSSQLKILEQSLDMRLFQKVGRQNQLTPTGMMVYGYCRQMFEISEEMGDLILKGLPSGTRRIQIGVSDEVDRPFVVDIVSHFLKKLGLEQRPRISVISGSHDQLVERLRFRELDAIVTQLAMIDPDLENLEKAEVPVALTCSGNWKIRSSTTHLKASAAVSEIVGGEDAQWLMPSARFRLRTEIDQFFELNQLKGRVVLESDVIASLVRSVVDEIGIAFLPLLYVGRELREKSIRVIGPKEGYWKYRVWLACHRQNKNDELIRSLGVSFSEICRHSP
jgi:LysR family transcriptional activator of nhaA